MKKIGKKLPTKLKNDKQVDNIKKSTLGYRLGDMVELWGLDHIDGKKYHFKNFPNSIASRYLKITTTVPHDVNILNKIISLSPFKDYKKPEKNELVIHVRLGDVIINEIPKLVFNSKKNHRYLRNKIYYDNIVKKLPKHIEKITLVTGFHYKNGIKKSKEYLGLIEKFLNEKGYKNIQMFIDRNADEDFLYMSHCNYFVTSGGNFSNLVAKMVKHKNGTVYTI